MSADRGWISARINWLRDLWSRLYHLPYVHGVLSSIAKTFRGFLDDDCHIMAAAVSFYAVLSLIPFMLLLFSIAGYALEHFGQEFASQEDLFAHLAAYVKAVVPFLSDDFMNRLRGVTLNREAYGVTGLVILFVTSGLVFRSLELAFARVFKTDRHRSLLVHQLLFVAFILGIGLLFLTIHYLSLVGSSMARRDETFAVAFDRTLAEYAILRFGVTLLTGTLVFVVLLKYFSRQRVRFRASLFGGLLFAILWMTAAKLFAYYLTHLARFSLLYGSLASPAVIVVWIFYSALILLLCTEFTWVLQNRFWPIPVVLPSNGAGAAALAPVDLEERSDAGVEVNPDGDNPT